MLVTGPWKRGCWDASLFLTAQLLWVNAKVARKYVCNNTKTACAQLVTVARYDGRGGAPGTMAPTERAAGPSAVTAGMQIGFGLART